MLFYPQLKRHSSYTYYNSEEGDATFSFASIVWDCILRWCDIPTPPQFTSVLGIIDFAKNGSVCQRKRNTLISICYRTLWWIWKARCDRTFKENHINPTKVDDNVKPQVFTWIKHQKAKCKYNWNEWSDCPFIRM